MRVVFAGSPAAAVPSLRALARSRHEVAAVVTREDSAQGRKRLMTPTPVAAAAEELGLPIIRANRLDHAATAAITGLRPDLGVIVAYGGLVREPLLSVPIHGWINLHFSLLPRWRGAAPVQHAIIAGDEVTGAAVFQLVPELDAGDVFDSLTRRVGAHETAGRVLDELSLSGAELLLSVVDAIADGTAVARPQAGEPSFAPKLTLADARIDWLRSSQELHDLVRGVTPEPGAFTVVDDVRLKVLSAAVAHDAAPLPPGELRCVGGAVLVGTASEPLELIEVLPAGKRAMAASDWWRGLGVDRAVAS
ncbi:MAG: methionyl-tRNA formyltransferase [Cryobacterium sp.]|nr:methionyl-tRNA formyltransferase [Cryobacterium sp.]